MNRLWKPLDLMGLRLYQVLITWPAKTEVRNIDISAGAFALKGHQETRMVFASAPRHAAQIVSEAYREMPIDRRPSVTGRAVQICQPAEWFDAMPMVIASGCKHDRFELIRSFEGMGQYKAAYICLDCGTIQVQTRKGGVSARVHFGLHCDQHLLAAARYMRDPLQCEQAIKRCQRHSDTDSPGSCQPGVPPGDYPQLAISNQQSPVSNQETGGRQEAGGRHTVASPLIAIAGLPGSGKSTLLKELGKHGYMIYDDIGVEDLNSKAFLVSGKLRSGAQVAMADIEFCDASTRAELEARFEQHGLPVSWIMFENAPWTCATNCLFRFMYEKRTCQLQGEIEAIQRLTKSYETIQPRAVVNAALRAVAAYASVGGSATISSLSAGGEGRGEVGAVAPEGVSLGDPCDCETCKLLRVALGESVKLQSHYATLLNQWDGGGRMWFRDADDWMTRLCETGTLRRCKLCGQLTADWVDPDWAQGRICRPCETRMQPCS